MFNFSHSQSPIGERTSLKGCSASLFLLSLPSINKTVAILGKKAARYIEEKVKQNCCFDLLKLSWTVYDINNICLHLHIVFHLSQPSNKHIIIILFWKTKQ
jgi:hypothetical protein